MNTALVAVALVLSGSLSAQSTLKKEYVPLQGTWDLVEVMGEKIERGELRVIFDGENYTMSERGEPDERGHVTLDPSRKPMQIAMVIKTGRDAGKVLLGFIEVAGDKMRIVLNSPGDPRFPVLPSDEWLTLKRSKKTS